MKVKRIYIGKDVAMRSRVSTVLMFFEKHLADFTAFDPHLNAAYLADWKAAHTETDNHAIIWDKEAVVIEDQSKIKDSDKALKKCRAKYMDVKYFAGKAFPDNKEALKEFGEGQYSKVYKSRLRMVQFMETLYGVATKYKVQLIAQGYNQSAITEIDTLANELRDDNNLQQLKKKERPTETRTRIEALNAFYSFGQPVHEAAQTIYSDNRVLRDEFRLAMRHHPKVSKSWFNIGSSDQRKITLPKLLKHFTLTLTNQSKETIEYWRADHIKDTPLQKLLLEAEESIPIQLAIPARKFLIIHNPSLKEARVMLKKEMKEKPESGFEAA